MNLQGTCLIFPYSRVNGNAISVLLATLDIDPVLVNLEVFLPHFRSHAKDLKEEIRTYDHIILAFSAFSTQISSVSEKIEEYRSIFSDRIRLVILGGPHAMGSPSSALQHGADVVCTGEGEFVFPALIQLILAHPLKCTEFNSKLRDIRGIALFDGMQQLVRTGRAKSVDLDDFPPFSVRHGLIRPIEITRGCAWNCRFCQTRSRGLAVKHRSLDNILPYIQETINYFRDRRADIRFVSPNALSYGSENGRNVNLIRVEELLRGVRDIIGIDGKIYFGSFPSEVRPETITTQSVALLKKYTNASKIILGGQSGSDEMLLKSERGHTAARTIEAVEILLNAGFKVEVDIIFGLPGESDDDVDETREHIKKLVKMGAIIHSHTFMPLVGTPFANKSPGTVHPKYSPLIQELQSKGKLYGSHKKQEINAKIMADRRKEEQTS